MQICRYANKQICKYADIQIFNVNNQLCTARWNMCQSQKLKKDEQVIDLREADCICFNQSHHKHICKGRESLKEEFAFFG